MEKFSNQINDVKNAINKLQSGQNMQEVRNMPRLKWLFLGVRADPNHPFHNIYKLLRNLLAKAMAPFKRFIGPIFTKLGYPYPTATSLFEIIWDWGEMNFGAIFELITSPMMAGIKFSNIFAGFVPGVGGKESLQERVIQFLLQLLGFAVAALVIFFQFRVLQGLLYFFDWFAGTDYTTQANWLMKEYLRFIVYIFHDSASLLFRTFRYSTTGGGPPTPNTWTAGLRSDKPLFFMAKEVVGVLSNILQELPKLFVGEENVNWINKEWNSWTWIFGYLRKQGEDWKEWSQEIKKAATIMVYATVGEFSAGMKTVIKAIGDIAVDPVEIGRRAFSYFFPDVDLSWITTGDPEFMILSLQPHLQPHNVMTVCSILGISKSTFDSLENKKMVKYVNENPLHTGQVFCAVVHADRELRQRKVKSCTTLSLRF